MSAPRIVLQSAYESVAPRISAMSFVALLPWLLPLALLPAIIRVVRGHPWSWAWAAFSLLAVPTGIGWVALLGMALVEPPPAIAWPRE